MHFNAATKSVQRQICDFEKVSGKLKIFANPFSCDIDDVPSNLQMNVIDLQSNDTLKKLLL
jgi:hypothetical protein